MKKKFSLMLFLLALSVALTFAQGESGTTLSATVTCTAHHLYVYGWTIDKSVTPDTWNLFTGDKGTSQYTISVTKDNGADVSTIDGQVTVTNEGDVATENLAIMLDVFYPVNAALPVVSIGVVVASPHDILNPGESWSYTYAAGIPFHTEGTYKVTARVAITNHSGHLGVQFGPNPSSTCMLPLEATLVNNEVTVVDDNGSQFAFGSSGSTNYNKTFLSSDVGTHKNTATVLGVWPVPSATASVTVNSYSLSVTKTAGTSLKRTYNWTIDKSADQSSLTLAAGETFVVNYTVKVDATHIDSDWKVAGTLSVHNPAPISAVINGISDVVSSGIAATGDCGVTFPYTLAAGGTLTCTYSAGLPDASSRTNTAAATLQNHSYDYQLNSTTSGTTDFSGTAAVEFAGAAITAVDKCADVIDSYAGNLGTVCAGVDALPKNFTYSRTVGPFSTSGDYPVGNVATSATEDQSVITQDSWNIAVAVPVSGCTLTPGYWKTHSQLGPAPYDDNWATLGPEQEQTLFFLSGQTYYTVLWATPKGNPYYILARAYIGAQLNQLNGADFAAAAAAFSSATLLFNTYTPAAVDALKPNNPVRQSFVAYASTLDDYNNGLIGPGHCSEQLEPNPDKGKPEKLAVDKPSGFVLDQNYPNPFNPVTQIRFAVEKPGQADLLVFNTVGQVVATLFTGYADAGRYYYVEFDAGNFASGVYFYRLHSGDKIQIKKLMILR